MEKSPQKQRIGKQERGTFQSPQTKERGTFQSPQTKTKAPRSYLEALSPQSFSMVDNSPQPGQQASTASQQASTASQQPSNPAPSTTTTSVQMVGGMEVEVYDSPQASIAAALKASTTAPAPAPAPAAVGNPPTAVAAAAALPDETKRVLGTLIAHMGANIEQSFNEAISHLS